MILYTAALPTIPTSDYRKKIQVKDLGGLQNWWIGTIERRLSKRVNDLMLPKIIGIISGILAVGVYAWKFKETPLCRP